MRDIANAERATKKRPNSIAHPTKITSINWGGSVWHVSIRKNNDKASKKRRIEFIKFVWLVSILCLSDSLIVMNSRWLETSNILKKQL